MGEVPKKRRRMKAILDVWWGVWGERERLRDPGEKGAFICEVAVAVGADESVAAGADQSVVVW